MILKKPGWVVQYLSVEGVWRSSYINSITYGGLTLITALQQWEYHATLLQYTRHIHLRYRLIHVLHDDIVVEL